MVDKKVLGPVLDVLLRTLPRDNLLSSACLELFVLINKENLKELIKHVVENYREKIAALSYMDTFDEILHRYDQTQGFTLNLDPYLESEDELGRARPPNGAVRGMMEHIALDPAQEDYWNASDDEEDIAVSQAPAEELRQSLDMPKPLVEYNSDDEADDADTSMANLGAAEGSTTPPTGDDTASTTGSTSPQAAQTNGTATASSPASTSTPTTAVVVTPPPERVSEKRRREEDEDDDVLDKLTQNKRRNSSSAASNASASASSSPSSNAPTLKKKKSFSGASGGGSPNGGTGSMKKIAISISPAIKAAVKADESAGGAGAGGGGD